jgi:hypothetical protein
MASENIREIAGKATVEEIVQYRTTERMPSEQLPWQARHYHRGTKRDQRRPKKKWEEEFK